MNHKYPSNQMNYFIAYFLLITIDISEINNKFEIRAILLDNYHVEQETPNYPYYFAKKIEPPFISGHTISPIIIKGKSKRTT